MRVIAGELRGRKLHSPPGRTARPMTDRVREAVFNALASIDVIRDARVLDCFAGSGALGIEALSRGAEQATFVERDRSVRRVVEQNIADLGLTDRATVVAGDAERFLADTAEAFDLAFLDPPYAFSDWPGLLAAVPAEVVVVRSDRPIPVPSGWGVLRDRRYGSTLVAVLERTRPSPPE